MGPEAEGCENKPEQTARIGGTETCDHPVDDRTYLGHMGAAGFYQCDLCEGVVIKW